MRGRERSPSRKRGLSPFFCVTLFVSFSQSLSLPAFFVGTSRM